SPTLMFRRLPSLTNATAATQIYALSLHDALPIYLANTDMLAVRYAAPEEATTLTSGVMYVRSDMARGEVFDGGVGATGSYSVDAEDHALVTHLYYVRPYTRVAGDNLPSLRRIRLAPGPALVDEEIIS